MNTCAICRDEEYTPHLGCRQMIEDLHAEALRVAPAFGKGRAVQVEGSDCQSVAFWFPRGLKDSAIRAEIDRMGYNPYGWDCACGDGDCCGRTFSRGAHITQYRNGKYADLCVARCC